MSLLFAVLSCPVLPTVQVPGTRDPKGESRKGWAGEGKRIDQSTNQSINRKLGLGNFCSVHKYTYKHVYIELREKL